MSFPNSAGVIDMGGTPKPTSCALVLGSATTALICSLSLPMTSARAALGAAIPNQPSASYPGTNSPTEGTSGKASTLVVLVTASARNLPSLTYSIACATVEN